MLKDSQTQRPSKCSTFYIAWHIFSQAHLVQNINSKSVCLLGTTAGVIWVGRKKIKKLKLNCNAVKDDTEQKRIT